MLDAVALDRRDRPIPGPPVAANGWLLAELGSSMWLWPFRAATRPGSLWCEDLR
jgi:hypothetical protein